MINMERGQPEELVYQESSEGSVSATSKRLTERPHMMKSELTTEFSNMEIIGSFDPTYFI